MNAEAAKVPDVEGHWKSIEIFLFSNGQQNTPPRKYHLRADELNVWDDTLNLLAQSHYGRKTPLINLYSTEGQLVEGPLELKDGLAYVAVTPPDTYIDAGYQKYLIRASRSWEKRQARKKIPECVTEELCCLCPEKEWCCDLQTCCLCPEKEDKDSAKSLFCATGYAELKPAEGHIMSSAPLKPAATDDNRPRSGKTASTAGKYTVRSGEYGARPGDFGYSPVESPAKPDEYRAGIVEYGANPSENGLRLSENGSRRGEFRARPDEYDASPSEFGLDKNVSIVSKNGVKPVEYGTRLNENGARPGEYVPCTLSENGPKVSKDGARLREYGTKPGENAAIPGEYETIPSVDRAKQGEYRARPGEFKTRPSINGARSSVNSARPGKYEVRSSEQKARSGEYNTRRSFNGDTSENGVRPVEYYTRPTIIGAHPNEYKARPGENEAMLGEYKPRPVENESRSIINGVKPNQYAAKPAEYETEPGVNGAKPNEYETRPSEYETRPTVNEAKSSQYETRPSKYETTPTVNGAIPGEHRARPGEKETRRSVNGAKPSENGARTGENESRPRENGAKPGELLTRTIIHEAKPGENRARSGEFADRSAEQKTRSDEYGWVNMSKDGASYDADGIRPTVYEAAQGNDRPCSNEIEPKKEAYKMGLRDNEISLDKVGKVTVDKDAAEECEFPIQSSTLSPIGESALEKKGEYGVTESDLRDKHIDPKGRASENGGRRSARRVSGGEQSGRENDTVKEMSEPRTIEIENARRPSQQRGEIEHTRRLSRQAGAETNPVGRARVTAARLSEQRKKQFDHLARLGVRESRVGDHEARAGDLGLRTSNHDARLINPGSTIADTGARAAVSGSRACPRDKMNSIARSSNSGQPKLGTPGTRVDETAAKLGESEIKNRVGYPGARQSNIVETGAAEASHMSKAQLHTRRTSLFAGRASTEKKHLSVGQNSSMLRKPTLISSVLRKSEDKQSIKTNKNILLKKTTGKASAIPVLASIDVGQLKTLPRDPSKPFTSPALPTLPSITNQAPLENIIDEKEIIVVSTHLFREPESEIRSMKFDSVKQVGDVIKNSPEETQTELIYVEKSMVCVSVNEGVQTNTEPVEQHEKVVYASSQVKINLCTCTCALCCKRDHRHVTVDPDENIISIQNKGDVINLKLNIEVRNIMRSVYSCQKNRLRSRSLTNIPRSEKESRISIEDGMIVRRESSLQLKHQYFRGSGFEGSPKAMVVQCAGCGRLNYPPRCDQPPCYNYKKNFVLLANSMNENMDDCCNSNPPCRPCGLKQSQLKKSCSSFPIKQTLSEMTLDTITTVTGSEVPLQRREMVKNTDTACQSEEPQGECKVSISEDSGTRCNFQKESSSSISVTTQVDYVKTKDSCRKLCPQKCEHEDSQVCSDFCHVQSCQKVQSACSQVSSEACLQVQSKGCHQTSLQVQSQGCMPVSPICSPCPKPLPCIQVQTQVSPQVPQVSDAQTQTQWSNIVLQARLHPDGRYSFHLPPLNVLNSFQF